MGILDDRMEELAAKSADEFKCFSPLRCCSCAHRHYCPALDVEK